VSIPNWLGLVSTVFPRSVPLEQKIPLRETLTRGTQYSYVSRNTWSGTNSGKTVGLQPGGLDSMVFTSFRYYLP